MASESTKVAKDSQSDFRDADARGFVIKKIPTRTRMSGVGRYAKLSIVKRLFSFAVAAAHMAYFPHISEGISR
jgi:hypothetical protein